MKLSFLSSAKPGGSKKAHQVIPVMIFKTLRRHSDKARSTQLSEEDLEHLEQYLNIEKAQIDEQYQLFLSIRPDGTISKKCFRSMLGNCFPGGNVKKMSKHVWRMFDTNQDGVIDFREFIMVVHVMDNGSTEDNLNQIFRVFDIDEDGKIDIEEMKRIVKDLSKLENKTEKNVNKYCLAQSVFKEMDENEDGKISQEEFTRACLGKKSFHH